MKKILIVFFVIVLGTIAFQAMPGTEKAYYSEPSKVNSSKIETISDIRPLEVTDAVLNVDEKYDYDKKVTRYTAFSTIEVNNPNENLVAIGTPVRCVLYKGNDVLHTSEYYINRIEPGEKCYLPMADTLTKYTTSIKIELRQNETSWYEKEEYAPNLEILEEDLTHESFLDDHIRGKIRKYVGDRYNTVAVDIIYWSNYDGSRQLSGGIRFIEDVSKGYNAPKYEERINHAVSLEDDYKIFYTPMTYDYPEISMKKKKFVSDSVLTTVYKLDKSGFEKMKDDVIITDTKPEKREITESEFKDAAIFVSIAIAGVFLVIMIIRSMHAPENEVEIFEEKAPVRTSSAVPKNNRAGATVKPVKKSMKEEKKQSELEQILKSSEADDKKGKSINEFIDSFIRYYHEVHDTRILTPLYNIIGTTKNINEEAKQDNSHKEDIRRFQTYYLPSLEKMLRVYSKLEMAEQTEEIIKTRRNIEKYFAETDKLFSKFYVQLLDDDTLDVEAEIKVMSEYMKNHIG